MKKKLIYLFLGALVLRLIFSFLVWHPDVNNHIDWGLRFWEYGPKDYYMANVWNFTWPNQPPGTMYLFAGIYKLYLAIFSIFWKINVSISVFPSNIVTLLEERGYQALVQLPAILADFGIAYLIYWILKKIKTKKLAIFGAALFLVNPIIWYNSAVWGQTDAIINFLALLAFVLLLEKKLTWAVLALVVSLYIKVSLLIFVPVFAIIVFRQKYKLIDIVKSAAVSLLVIGVLTLPFAKGEPYSWLFQLYKDKIFTQQLQVITANAFNVWAAITGIYEQPHTLMLGPLTYQVWGLILFGISLIYPLYLVYKKQDYISIFWALAIISFSSFMLLTNMHERYLYPLFPAFTILAATDKRLLSLYWAVSGLSLVNLYNIWWTPKIEWLVNLLSDNERFFPRILGLVNFGLFANLYTRFLRLFKPAKL
jgi:Gpi18-like mannosyltransferase